MPEKHTIGFDYYDLNIEVADEGAVRIEFAFPEPVSSIAMDFDEFREVIEHVGKFGMGMKDPYLVEYADTRESIEA